MGLGSNDLATSQRRRRLAAAALAIVAFGLFAAAALSALHPQAANPQLQRVLPPPDARARLEAAGGVGPRDFATVGPGPTAKATGRKQMPVPARIRIPAIGVKADVIHLGLNRDRTLQVPKNFAQAGWFVNGPEPGERGAAVIAGHVDSRSGPAVFYRLRALQRGDKITIVLKNGSWIHFVVTGTKVVSKKRFPTSLVYEKTDVPTLRLITCDGAFDRSTGHYVDNYLVFAKFVG